MNRGDKFIQIAGSSKGQIVTFIRLEGGFARLHCEKYGFEYLTSEYNLNHHYKPFKRTPVKVIRTPVRRI